MKRLRPALATSLLCLALWPATAPAAPAHEHEHADEPAATDPRYHDQMQRMQHMHERMDAASPAERRRLMPERMKLMQEGMALMHRDDGGAGGMCQCAERERRLKAREEMMDMMLQLMPNERLADHEDKPAKKDQ